MHIFFSGIGGTAIGPLALIAHQAGYTVSGSDKQDSQYIQYLRKHGIETISIGQTSEAIATIHNQSPIDWIVYSSAVAIENPNHPEFMFANNNQIRLSKRDELLNKILDDTGKKMIAIAGTHGKTTTTAMAIWLFKQLDIPISYSVGAKIPFGEMGQFNADSKYFIYECDEFDRNFLAFSPYISLVTGIDYDHHEIFPTIENYQDAFRQFLSQSERTILWQSDVDVLGGHPADTDTVLQDTDTKIDTLTIPGHVNRRNAWQVIQCAAQITGKTYEELSMHMESFPGLSRRFEKLIDGLYTDYAHTVPKIAGCLQMARELSDNVVVVYEPLTDRRQHYIRQDYAELFQGVKKLYWVPSYLAREDPNQSILTPAELISNMNNPDIAEPSSLDDSLKQAIELHIEAGDLVICMTGGGGNSLDEWLRREFK